MARDFAKGFYNSKAWRRLSASYKKQVHGICERCGEAGTEVHHKIHLTPSNINDPNITLNRSNLELLCYKCHQNEHYRKKKITQDDVCFDEYGDVIQRL